MAVGLAFAIAHCLRFQGKCAQALHHLYEARNICTEQLAILQRDGVDSRSNHLSSRTNTLAVEAKSRHCQTCQTMIDSISRHLSIVEDEIRNILVGKGANQYLASLRYHSR